MLLLVKYDFEKINILEYAFGEGGGGRQKAYAEYAFINVDNCERPLRYIESSNSITRIVVLWIIVCKIQFIAGRYDEIYLFFVALFHDSFMITVISSVWL